MQVTVAYARANLSKLLRAVEKGERVTILRYRQPIADLVPSVAKAPRPAPKFGTGKGKVRILDPNWAAPLTDKEADAYLEGRY